MGRPSYILPARPAIDDSAAKISTNTKPAGEIEFRGLTFTYPTSLAGNDSKVTAKSNGQANSYSNGSHPVLQNINLKIPAGSTLAIVGPTASGKTTLAALIARLWEAPDGEVLIDGRPIREWPLDTLRRSLGYVPPDTYLFSESVGGNIAFGLPDDDPHPV